jgi:hypothetical protein
MLGRKRERKKRKRRVLQMQVKKISEPEQERGGRFLEASCAIWRSHPDLR